MRRIRLTALVVAAIVLLTAVAAQAHPTWKHEIPVAAPLLHMLKWHRSETWRLQDLMGQRRTPTAYRERTIESVAYRAWQVGLWKHRHQQARREWQQFLASWQGQERNAYRAIRAAASFWGVSYGWLVSCAQSEGLGDGGSIIWTPNGSGAAGPFQFLSGTFYSYAPAAFAATDRRGLHIPRVYLRWTSTVGQAWTAAFMFSRGLSHHWYGSGC